MLTKIYCDNLYLSLENTYDPENMRSFHLIKAHYCDRLGPPEDGSTVLTCYRDVRGAAGSMIRMGWLQDDRQTLLNWCGEYARTKARLMPIAKVAMRYEDMLDDPLSVAVYTASQLGFHEGLASDAIDEVAKLRPPAPEPTTLIPHNDVTQLHPGHVGERLNARSASYISRKNLDAIEDAFSTWLTVHHYPLPLIPQQTT